MRRFTLNDFFGNKSSFDCFKQSVIKRINKKRIIYMSSEQIIIDDSQVQEIIDDIKDEALEEPCVNDLLIDLKKIDDFRKNAYDLKMNYLLQMRDLAKRMNVSDEDLIREMKNLATRIEFDLQVAGMMAFDFPSVKHSEDK